MAEPFPFRGAIFDLDGTLLDSMHVWSGIDRAFLQKRGLTVPPGYSDVLAPMTFRETAEYTIDRFHLDESPEAIMAEWDQMAIEAYSRHVALKPHAKAYLAYLRGLGVRLGVCTSLSRALYVPALERCGILPWFDAIVSSDDAHAAKSTPAPFLLTAKRLGLFPKECVVFEDVAESAAGAAAAGMTVYGVYDKSAAGREAQLRAIAAQYIYDFAELLPSSK